MLRSQLVVLLVILGAAVACGGATTEGPSSSSSSGGSGTSGSGGTSGTSGAVNGGGVACTDIGCANGFALEFSYRDRGAYVFDLTVDGVFVTCKATIPLARDSASACSSNAAQLGLVGSMLPESEQSIGGLMFFSAPKTVTVKASRDGTTLVDTTVTPTYVVTPGPNGPDCDPKECKSAKLVLPR